MPLLPLWAIVSCSRVNFTFTFTVSGGDKFLRINGLENVRMGSLISLVANARLAYSVSPTESARRCEGTTVG